MSALSHKSPPPPCAIVIWLCLTLARFSGARRARIRSARDTTALLMADENVCACCSTMQGLDLWR